MVWAGLAKYYGLQFHQNSKLYKLCIKKQVVICGTVISHEKFVHKKDKIINHVNIIITDCKYLISYDKKLI